MSRSQIIFSVSLMIVSLAVGYYLSQQAQRNANRVFLKTLREELDVVEDHYERRLEQEGRIDENMRGYLTARRDYLTARLKTLEAKT